MRKINSTYLSLYFVGMDWAVNTMYSKSSLLEETVGRAALQLETGPRSGRRKIRQEGVHVSTEQAIQSTS